MADGSSVCVKGNSGVRQVCVRNDVLICDRVDSQTGEIGDMRDRQLVQIGDRQLVERGVSQMKGWSRLGGHYGAGDDPTWAPGGAETTATMCRRWRYTGGDHLGTQV